METNKKYLSVEEVAAELGYSPQYIRTLAKSGRIPAFMVGKTWVIDKASLLDPIVFFKILKDVPDRKREKTPIKGFKALSFFSGAMGLDIGIEKAGISFLLASEFEPNARKTILLNKPTIGLIGDINKYDATRIREYAGLEPNEEIDLIVGGPPCQAFSTAGKREAFNDERGNVFLTYINRILELRPKYAVIENVRGLLSAPYSSVYTKKGLGYAAKTPEEQKGLALYHIITLLEKGGYSVSFTLYNAANYGAPQKRERVVIMCSRDGKRIPYLKPTNSEKCDYNLPKWKTIKEAFEGLDTSNPEYIPFPERRLKYYRILKEGQYWKDLPIDLQKEALGNSYYLGGGKTGFLRRLAWNQPSPTLVTDPTMPATDLAHPTEDRPLSVQEYKRIQEFPDDWKIFGSTKEQYRQIGNAVPISLGYAIGKQLVTLLNGNIPEEAPDGFPFSRYEKTDDVSFKKSIESKIFRQIIKQNNQLDLFEC